MKTKLLFISMMLVAILFTSCYKPEEDVTLDDYDITLTYYDTEFDFKAYQTFAIRDSVLLISDYLTEKQIEEFYSNGTSDEILAKISSELTDLGYTLADNEREADFLMNPTVTLMEKTDYYYYPGWWWGYGGYWGWYWKSTNYYYPYYPSWGYSYSYTYETGSLIMEILNGPSVIAYLEWLDENGPDADPTNAPKVELNWTGHIEGIVGSSASYNENRAQRGIEEAFTQSPYLKK